MQIDVDIGSSSVARGVIGLVLGYVTSLVVDLAILIEVCVFLPLVIIFLDFWTIYPLVPFDIDLIFGENIEAVILWNCILYAILKSIGQGGMLFKGVCLPLISLRDRIVLMVSIWYQARDHI